MPDIQIGEYRANTTIFGVGPNSAIAKTTIRTPTKIPGVVIPGKTAGCNTKIYDMTLDCKDQTVDIKDDGKG